MQIAASKLTLCWIAVATAVSCGGSEFTKEGSAGVGKPDSGNGSGGGSASGGAGGNAGSGGAPGDAATGGTSSGGAGGDGTGGSGAGGGAGSGGVSGSGGISGNGGGGPVDSGTQESGVVTPSDSGVVCSDPVTYYLDGDGDGYGRSTTSIAACSPPTVGRWVIVGGDCDDDNTDVHPNQATYFPDPFSTSGGGHSFDYDCTTAEEGDPSQIGAAPTCPLSSLGCTGSGYVPTTRTGSGVNPLCGSKVQSTCKPAGLGCSAVRSDVTVAYRCR